MAMTVDPDLVNSVTNSDTHSLASVFKSGKEEMHREHCLYSTEKRANQWCFGLATREGSLLNKVLHVPATCKRRPRSKREYFAIYPPGKTHSSFYATSTRYEDPANRLAFRIVYTDLSSGQEVDEYAFRSVYSAVCRANTLVDILWDGKSDEDIIQTPRQYLEVTAQKAKAKPYLETFVKGGYTGTFLELEEQEQEEGQEDDIDKD